jgi:hypothetical protein
MLNKKDFRSTYGQPIPIKNSNILKNLENASIPLEGCMVFKKDWSMTEKHSVS